MKAFIAALFFMMIVFIVLSREIPGPSRSLAYRIGEELSFLKH